MSQSRKRQPYSGPIVGEDIPPPPLWKLLLTATLVLVPTVWIGLMIYGHSPRNDAVRIMTRASDAILRHVQAHNQWPESMEGIVPVEYQAFETDPVIYNPQQGTLSLELKEPFLLPSFSHRISFGLLGSQQQWDSIEVNLVQRLEMMRLTPPALPGSSPSDVQTSQPETHENPLENSPVPGSP